MHGIQPQIRVLYQSWQLANFAGYSVLPATSVNCKTWYQTATSFSNIFSNIRLFQNLRKTLKNTVCHTCLCQFAHVHIRRHLTCLLHIAQECIFIHLFPTVRHFFISNILFFDSLPLSQKRKRRKRRRREKERKRVRLWKYW